MNNNPLIKPEFIPNPFTRFCMTVGYIPSSYLDSLDYMEQILWLIKFLQEKVIPAVDNNAAAVTELQQFYLQLQSYVNNYFDNLDVQEEINNKLDEMASDGTLENLININLLNKLTDNFILYAFFDENENNKVKLYTSKDGVNLTLLNIDTGIYGRDPSINKVGDTYYIATTDYDTDYDFVIYTSKDLANWKKHEINCNLYNSDYPRRWAPDLYVEDNDLYVLLSVQYANTERSGDFRNYLIKCNDLDNLTFDEPQQLNLSGTTSDNYIDCNLSKINGVYHLIIKNETTSAVEIEHFTSVDMINYLRIDSNYGDFGQYREAPFLIKYGEFYYLYVERYGYNINNKSVYAVKRTEDLIHFTNIELVNMDNIDLSHGSALVITDMHSKNIIRSLDNFTSYYNDYFTFRNQQYLNAFATYRNEVKKGNYLKIMSIKPKRSYKNISIIFNIADVQNARRINSLCSLYIRSGNVNSLSNDNFQLKEISGMQFGNMIDPKLSLFGKLIVHLNTSDNCYDLFLDLSTWDSDMTIATSIISCLNANASDIVMYEDTFFNDLPANVDQGMRFVGRCWSDSPFTKNLYIDAGTKNT